MQDERRRFLFKVVLVSAVTATVVFLVLALASAGVYYFICCEPIAKLPPGGDPGQTRASSTDAAKITSVSFGSWSHLGPLYPGPNDPPGYVSGRSVTFRRDLNATRQEKKDYDRDLPDEISNETATLTSEQFEALAKVCADHDLVNEADSTNNRTEAGTTLTIEYDGAIKKIVTSNTGNDSAAIANVLAAVRHLERSVNWGRRSDSVAL
jgi:hypothetical protein